jgi:hypothetical protein
MNTNVKLDVGFSDIEPGTVAVSNTEHAAPGVARKELPGPFDHFVRFLRSHFRTINKQHDLNDPHNEWWV